MTKRMILMLLAVGLFFGSLFGWKAFVGEQIRLAIAASGPPVATVSVATVQRAQWQPTIDTVATLNADQSVDVSAQVGGQVTEIHFQSGDEVARGALLMRQYADDDRAQLRALQADLRLAELELARIEQLVKEKLVPQRDLDVAESSLERTRAEVENLDVAIGKKTIRAPFAGRLGIRKVNLGQFIEPGDPIVRLESLDRLYADFKLPQQSLPQVYVGQAVSIAVDAWPGDSFRGEITAIEPAVDTGTRNLSLRAHIDNGDGRLRPGMFVRIEVVLPERRDVLLIPQAAISFSPFGNSVFVLERTAQGALVRNIYVGTGETRGDLVEVLSGLESGQEVVTAGQQKLRDGATVNVDNSVPVNASANPEPAES